MEQKESVYIKRPFEALSKKYKEYKLKERPEFLRQAENLLCARGEVTVSSEDVANLFLLYEENLNLPDMNQEELNLIFPYVLDCILGTWHYMYASRPCVEKKLNKEKAKQILVLAKTKRIPLILGHEYERCVFYNTEKTDAFFASVYAQVDKDVLKSYMPMMLKTGMFPGANEKVKHLESLRELLRLYAYYSRINSNLRCRLLWYTWGEEERGRKVIPWTKHFDGEKIEIEWKLVEYLQVRLMEWENRKGLTKEEQEIFDSYAALAKQEERVLLQKQELALLLNLAGKSVIDREENGKRLANFMKMEGRGLKIVKNENSDGSYPKSRMTNTYTYHPEGTEIEICLRMQKLDEERHELKKVTMTGMEQDVKITIDGLDEEYWPVFQYEDIPSDIFRQNYAKMCIEGEEKVEIFIPRIESIGYKAFHEVRVKELVISHSVEEIKAQGFLEHPSLQMIKLGDCVKLLEKEAFAKCKNLVRVTLESQWLQKTRADVFAGCTSLDNMIGPDGLDYLNLDVSEYAEGFGEKEKNRSGNTVFYKDNLFWEKIIRTAPKKLLYLKEQSSETDLEYEAERYVICEERNLEYITCPSIEEVQVLEGTKCIFHEFYPCVNLRKIVLPESLKLLAYNAFEPHNELTEIILPKNAHVEIYSTNRWERWDGDFRIFKKLVIPDDHVHYKKVDGMVLEGNTLCWVSDDKEGKVVVPEGVEYIGEKAFSGCSKIQEIHLPNTLKIIEYGAFFGCDSLKEIVIDRNRVQIDLKEPDPEMMSYWGTMTSVESGREYIFGRSLSNQVAIRDACGRERREAVQEKAPKPKKRQKGLTYRPFAKLYELFEDE